MKKGLDWVQSKPNVRGSQVLRDMRMGIDLNTVRSILESCRENITRMAVYCIIGFPTDTKQELGQAIEFLKDTRDAIDYIGFHQFVLNSGSDVSARSWAYGVSETKPPSERCHIS